METITQEKLMKRIYPRRSQEVNQRLRDVGGNTRANTRKSRIVWYPGDKRGKYF